MIKEKQKGYSFFWTIIFLGFISILATLGISIAQIYIQKNVVRESVIIGIREAKNSNIHFQKNEITRIIEKKLRNSAVSLKPEQILKFTEKDYGFDIILKYDERADWIKNFEILLPVEEAFNTK